MPITHETSFRIQPDDERGGQCREMERFNLSSRIH